MTEREYILSGNYQLLDKLYQRLSSQQTALLFIQKKLNEVVEAGNLSKALDAGISVSEILSEINKVLP